MKEAIITDVNGYYQDVEPVPIEVYGVTPLFFIPAPEPTDEEPAQPVEPSEPEPILIGYRVAVPLPQLFFKPRFDIAAWEAAQSAHWSAVEAYLAAMAAYDPEGGLPEPQPPTKVVDASFWIEGLTQAEIDAIVNAPVPPSIDDKVTQLQTESVDTMLALAEVYETNAVQDAAREQEGVDTMLALTEAYELIIQQQADIAAMKARLEALEGGAS